MPKLVLRKHLGSLRPADEQSEDWLRKIANGDLVMAEIRKPRNIQHHRKLWALLKLVCDNMDQPITPEMLLGIIKLRTGYCDVVQTRKGDVVMPKSIAFESMDQLAFNEFWEKAVDFILSNVLLGVDSEALEREVYEMVA